MFETPTNGKRRSALGKGISALIPTSTSRPEHFLCALDRIRPMHNQPRQRFDETSIAELAGSIERDGLLQPVVVREEGGDYIIIAGERRWRAARLTGMTEIPVILKDVTEADAFALALVENLQREDLSPLETAEACQRLIDEHSFTQEEVAQRIGKSRSSIANTLRLLRLTPATQTALAHGLVTEGHARQLVGLDEDTQADLVDQVVAESLSVRETEALVRDLRQSKTTDSDPEPDAPKASRATAPTASAHDDSAIIEAIALLQDKLGVNVEINDRGGKGTINLHWTSYEGLEALVGKLSSD